MDSMLQSTPLSTVYPRGSEFWRPVTCTIYLLALLSLSSMITKRVPSWGKWKQAGPVKWSLLAILVDSCAFIFASALLVLGVGTSSSRLACNAGIWICIFLYSFAKVLITWFLIERVHVVLGGQTPRKESRLYKFNFLVMLGWLAVFIMLCVYHSTHIRVSDQACFIVDSPIATFMGVTVDLCIDIYLSLLFAIPLWKRQFSSPRMKWIAIKSLVAAGVSMSSSVTNLLIFTLLHGRELSWMCLMSCALDTMINATSLFALTASESQAADSRRSSFAPTVSASFVLPGSRRLSRKTSIAFQRDISTLSEGPLGERDDFEAPQGPWPQRGSASSSSTEIAVDLPFKSLQRGRSVSFDEKNMTIEEGFEDEDLSDAGSLEIEELREENANQGLHQELSESQEKV
ncbi:hypothetical protein T439DRAFT_349640 [Meredithblackwellia eburnea MCA 4105]